MKKNCLLLTVSLIAMSLYSAKPARAEDIRFPEGAGIIDITKAPYNAVGDGKADCTEAIQLALIDALKGPNIVYFPNGIYILKDTVNWKGRATRNMFQGQSRDGAIVRLPDNCAGFNDPSSPRPMVVTGYFPPQRFRNAIRNMTFSVGKGNPGAIAVRFNASNQGQLADVLIRSEDGAGVIGLDMGYTGDVGPLLVKNVEVVGFDVGIYTSHATACQTLEHIQLRNQRYYGWVNDGQAIAVRDLKSSNAVPALLNKRGSSMMTILGAELTGTGDAKNTPGIVNEAGLYVRHLSTPGYKMAVDGSTGSGVSEGSLQADVFLSHPAAAAFDAPARQLDLPIEETPEVPWDDPKDWVSVAKFTPKLSYYDGKTKTFFDEPPKGTKTDKVYDWTPAIQQAIDSGATTIYFPKAAPIGQQYAMLGTVHLRGNVRRIIGMETSFNGIGERTFVLDDGASPVVAIERFDWLYSGVTMVTNSKRILAAKALNVSMRVGPGGRAFIEDSVCAVRVEKGGSLWIRQFNTEYTHEYRGGTFWADMPWYEQGLDPTKDRDKYLKVHPGNLNDGGTVWILGVKSEGDGTLLTTINGGKSEVMGGLIYANHAKNPEKHAFVVKNSSMSFSLGEWTSRFQPFNMLEETRGDVTRELKRGQLPMRGSGALVTLVNAYADPNGPRAKIPGPAPASAPASEPATAPASGGAGLTIDIFEGEFGTLKATRVAAPEVATDDAAIANLKNWTVRFSGQVVVKTSGAYHFYPPPASRLVINDRVILDAWRNDSRYRDTSFFMEADKPYSIVLEAKGDAKTKVTLSMHGPRTNGREIEPEFSPRSAKLPQVTLTTPADQVLEKGGPLVLQIARDGDTSAPLAVRLAPSVNFSTSMVMVYAARGNAVAGTDYQPLPESVIIPAGQNTLALPVHPIDNRRYDPARSVVVELSPSTTYDISGSGRASVAVVDNDAPALGNGTGLQTTYFAGHEGSTPLAVSISKSLDFDWNETPPVKGIVMRDGFRVRWEGALLPLFGESYRLKFDVTEYAALRVWADGKIVIDFNSAGTDPKQKRNRNGADLTSYVLDCTAGKPVALKVEYESLNFYGQHVSMKWSSPSQFLQTIPMTQLLPPSP